jgi:hypothetical protein
MELARIECDHIFKLYTVLQESKGLRGQSTSRRCALFSNKVNILAPSRGILQKERKSDICQRKEVIAARRTCMGHGATRSSRDKVVNPAWPPGFSTKVSRPSVCPPKFTVGPSPEVIR